MMEEKKRTRKNGAIYQPVHVFSKYLPLIYSVDELWKEFEVYCKQFFHERDADFFAFHRDPDAMNFWYALLDNMGGGVPLVVFAAGAYLLLEYEKAGHDLDAELAAVPAKWKPQSFL